MSAVGAFSVLVRGRPAPQGSKKYGAAGQMREQSPYLPAWRMAVRRAVYKEYQRLDVRPDDLPLLAGPVGFSCVFRLDHGLPIDGPPDLDKLVRAVWDALTLARLWEDDSRVVEVGDLRKVVSPGPEQTGARIKVWKVMEP